MLLPQADSPAGVAVPGYVVGESIGSGGFGEVFRARHAVIGREVAIKVLHAKYSTDAGALARFVAEARAVNQISHPNIVQIFDFGTIADGRQYCVMELLRGTTLRALLRERGRLPLAEALPILRGIAEAVDAAHAAGIAHRDLKPDNVFVVEGGGIKLIDFGLAKLTREDPDSVPVTQTGAIVGTPLYMSPEQCRGKALDLRTDCYSFGVLAYHVLVGATPWVGEALELALHHLHDAPVPPSERCSELGAGVDRVVLALLAKSPSQRPSPLVAALAALDGGRLPIPRASRRRWWIAGAAALVIAGGTVVLVAGGGAAAAPRWSTRTLAWPTSELAVGLALAADGQSLIYTRADHTIWRRRLDGSPVTQLELVDPATVRSVSAARDGRLLVSRQEADGAWIWLEDAVPGRRDRVASGEHAKLGVDDRIAFVRGGQIYTRDLVTKTERLVASVGGGILNIAWSPDGHRLVWTRGVPDNGSRVELVDLRDGSVRQLPKVLITVSVEPLPIAFVGAATVVYCDGARRVQQLDLETNRQTTLLQLAPNIGVCAIEATGDGGRFVVATVGFEQSTAMLSTREPDRGWRTIARGGIEDFSADGRVVVAGWSPPGPQNFRTLYGETRLPPLSAVPVDGGAAVPLAGCPGATRAVRRASELLYNVNVTRDNALTMQLVRPGDCAVVDAWTIPDLPNWMFPRCGGELCATLRPEPGALAVWTLRRGETSARELARIATPRTPQNGWPDLAVSPDGRQIAVANPGAGDEVYVVDAEHGTVQTLHAGPAPGTDDTTNRAASVTWASDGRAVYVSGGGGGGHAGMAISAVTLVSLDGTSTPVWTQAAPSIGMWARTSPDGAWLGANRLDLELELHVFDRTE